MTATATVPRAALDLCVATRAAGLTTTAAAIGSSPDATFSALVGALTRPSRGVAVNVWPCSTPGCGRIAMLDAAAFASPDRDALGAAVRCDACDPDLRESRDAERVRERLAADALVAGIRESDEELRAWVSRVGVDTVAAALGVEPAEIALELEVAR